MNSSLLQTDAVVRRAPALVRDQVANYLRDQITSMKLPPGAPLIEREICEATTASRATVREALRQLESDGLVISAAGKGSFVAMLSLKEARDMYGIRARLEGLASRLFAENASSDQVGELVSSVDRLADAVDRPADMLAEKSTFYETLFAGADNSELHRILTGLRQRITLLRVSSLSVEGRPQRSLAEIKAIRDAILARDGDAAEKLTRAHIEAAAEAVLQAPNAYFRSADSA